jgi:hypothetical protein
VLLKWQCLITEGPLYHNPKFFTVVIQRVTSELIRYVAPVLLALSVVIYDLLNPPLQVFEALDVNRRLNLRFDHSTNGVVE